jgi:hypothetical protein
MTDTLTPKQERALAWLNSRRERCATQADATQNGFSRSVFKALERKGAVKQIHQSFIGVDKWVAT